MKSFRTLNFIAITTAMMTLAVGNLAQAQSPTLTPAGATLGFTITQTIIGFTPTPGGIGPLGISVVNGKIIVCEYPFAIVSAFPNVDGLTYASRLASASRPCGDTSLATTGGKVYGGTNGGQFFQVNEDGTLNHFLTFPSQPAITSDRGMWTDPVTGLLIASTGSSLVEINPATNGGLGSYRFITSIAFFIDGLTVSPDGTIAYVADVTNQVVRGYRISDGTLVFPGSGTLSGLDGMAVTECGNQLTGRVIVNTNAGNIFLLDPATNTSVLIASGGSRGDYVTPDPTNGTLLLSFTDRIVRLALAGCTLGSTNAAPMLVRYAANLSVGDSVVNLTNTGATSTGSGLANPATGFQQDGQLCANIYAYSPDEQLVACCSCNVTPNALNSLSVRNDLASNTLTAIIPSALVIKILTTPGGASCTAASAATVQRADLQAGLLAWGTSLHLLPATPGSPAGTYGAAETPFSAARISDAELTRMRSLCSFIRANGSGYGVCKSCKVGGLGGSTK